MVVNMAINRLVLDVLKPEEPSIVVISSSLSKIKGVGGVDITVKEVDKRLETVRIVLEGGDLDVDKIIAVIEKSGASVHSIDRVSSGKRIPEDVIRT